VQGSFIGIRSLARANPRLQDDSSGESGFVGAHPSADVTNEGGKLGGKPRSRKARDLGHPQYDQLSMAGSQFSVCSLEEEVAEGAAAYRNKCQASR
jgi:hypothetical protein